VYLYGIRLTLAESSRKLNVRKEKWIPSILMKQLIARPTLRLLGALTTLAGCLGASTIYSIPSGFSDTDGTVTGNVAFSLLCAASCTLSLDVSNTEANPTGAGQEISGLSFVLKNGSTVLTPGTLSSTTSNGAGGPITVLDSSFNATTTTTLPGTWQLSTSGSSFLLNDLTGGKPANMIIGPGPYTNANSSITGHAPSLAGTVEFTLSDITGLSASTVLSSVTFYYGTGPDASGLVTCTSGCGGPILLSGGSTPEPASLGIMGLGLLGLGVVARKRMTKPA
jgi:hypothetical protein